MQPRLGSPQPAATLVALGLLLSTHAGLAQDLEPSTFFETFDVNVVNVEVYVTDRRGAPVTGLAREDFQLFEDGEPVEVSNFFEVEAGQVAKTEEQKETEGGPEAPPELPAAQRSLSLIIYVDGINTTPRNRNRVLPAVRRFVEENLRPEDRVMVVSNDGSLQVGQSLTGDPTQVAEALEAMMGRTTRGAQADLERLAILRDIEQVSLSGDASIVESMASNTLSAIRNLAEREHQRVKLTVEQLALFVNSLAGLEGRKALLYASDGLALRPAEDLLYAWEGKFAELARNSRFLNARALPLEAEQLSTASLLEELVDLANANQVTFYSVRPAAGAASLAVSAEAGSLDMSAVGTPGGGRAWSAGLESIRTSNFGGSLQYLAEATGGQAMVNGTNFGLLLERMRQDFDSFYSLGYMPAHEADGETHRIEVRLKSPEKGWSVRHRERYRDKTRVEQMNDRTLSALLLGVESNPLEIAVEFSDSTPAERPGHFLVPVVVKVPIAKLVLVPQGEFHVGRVMIAVGASDSKGRSSPIQQQPLPIRIRNEQLLTAMAQVVAYEVQLLLKPERHTVAVGVHDLLGDTDSSVRVSYEPPPTTG